MALNGCSAGLLVTTVVALLFLPAQYYVPELRGPELIPEPKTSTPLATLDRMFAEFTPFDLFFTITLLVLGFLTYICEWIQRKIMERRIVKLNQYLKSSLERLRVWDAQQEQLETTLKLVQNATSEYNLLLYLLLRQHHCIAADKRLDDVSFLSPTVEV